MMPENEICKKCGILMTNETRFADGFCLSCYAKQWEIQFADALRQSRRIQAFGPELMTWPQFALVAETVYVNFPNTNMKLKLDAQIPTFELYDDKNLLLTIDAKGWEYASGQRSGTWSGIIEGNVFSVSEMILGNFAKQDYAVFKPEVASLSEYPIRGKKRMFRKPIDLMLRQCMECKQRGHVKKVYFGEKENQFFQEDYFVYGGKSRKRFDPFYKCLNCGWKL
jgi:hypothetical protein